MSKIELLMPAGSVKKMELTLDYGADAVYLGPPLYSLRARENHFDDEQLSQAISSVHAKGKKVYMTLNIFSRNRKLNPFREDILSFAKMRPDAFIMSDPGLASLAKELAPEIPIHLSVQANCMNWESVLFWKRSLGIERVILSRELSIQEISEIKQRVPDIELEAFVHGSICIAYSGRCLLSSYMDKRDANQGVCDNSCREKYRVFSEGDELLIEDPKNNPGSLYPIEEDEHGTYILNAKDLCMIEHLDKLISAGVISFKVEGRTKSEFYAAMIARAYRGALDDCLSGRSFNPQWRESLDLLTSRGYHTGFMLGLPGSHGQNYQHSTSYNKNVKFAGLIHSKDTQGYVVDVKNRIDKNCLLEVIQPNGSKVTHKVQAIVNLASEEKDSVHSGSGKHFVRFEESCDLQPNSLLLRYEH